MNPTYLVDRVALLKQESADDALLALGETEAENRMRAIIARLTVVGP